MSEGSSIAGVSAQTFVRNDFQVLIAEMREQNFDSIRFATYRAACKLRFVQKKANLHLVDIWNIIESFRENGLNALEARADIKISRTELLLSTVYHNLNKRLPTQQQIDTDRSIGLVLSFLLGAYDREDTGRLRVFSVKVALATLCAGKLLDKLRYIFSQISDSSGLMEYQKFVDYLREVLALATAVFEGPTFGFTDSVAQQCFLSSSKINVNNFLDTLMNDPCPPCLMWLPLLHRMSSVEHVYHPVVCDACSVESFTGFRYKCQRCTNYQLCQECFWRGRTSGAHSNQHEMKEYSSYKSPTKQLGHSIQKSLRCVPTQPVQLHPVFPDHPDRPLDLTNVVPLTSSLGHSRQNMLLPNTTTTTTTNRAPYDAWSMDGATTGGHLSGPLGFGETGGIDDEHKLIARYSAKLDGRTTYPPGQQKQQQPLATYDPTNIPEDPRGQRSMVARLEQQNREIMREIAQLQAMHNAGEGETFSTTTGAAAAPQATIVGPALTNEGGLLITAELDTLRERKSELETRMHHMQETRRELMQQLEHLVKVMKTNKPLTTTATMSPRDGSPRSLTGIGGEVRSAFRDSLISTTPTTTNNTSIITNQQPSSIMTHHHQNMEPIFGTSIMTSASGDNQQQQQQQIGSQNSLQLLFGGSGGSRTGSLPVVGGQTGKTAGTLQGDLLYAADDITRNMSSLVKGLDEAEANVEMDEAGEEHEDEEDNKFEDKTSTQNLNNGVQMRENGYRQ